MNKKIFKLENNIECIYKNNVNTPRIAFCLNFSVNNPEPISGIYSLMARLLIQGTKNYNSEQLANEFEKYAIDFSSELFPNYLRIKFLCLNEDFSKAIDLMYEVLTNSTFEEFEKERTKLSGEISADLDSPRILAMDAYGKTMFENHYYGNSMTKILENLDKISKEDVIKAFKDILTNSRKTLAIVGDVNENTVMTKIRETVEKLPISIDKPLAFAKPVLEKTKEVTTIKSDLNQAHIIKGWMVNTYDHSDYPVLVLLNILLGACGLSSRLFLELRDKKGLAYVVRSSYETFKLVGNFMIYIATEPSNIDISLKGFDEEINKIKTIKITEEELNNAKNNLIGKCAFLEETNMQQACMFAKYGVIGLGFDYSKKMKELVNNVTIDDILRCAQKYFTDENYVLSIVKP